MKQNLFKKQMEKDRARLENKEKTIEKIKKIYSRYGNKVVSIMLRYATSENGMQKLFRILKLPIGEITHEDEQHTAVINWINTNGERLFLQKHRQVHGNNNESFSVEPIITEDAKKPLYGMKTQEPKEVQKPAPPAAPPKEKTWNGIERRSGEERRKNPNRRQKVEMVFKNRRFGGERRSGKDRRANWKPIK